MDTSIFHCIHFVEYGNISLSSSIYTMPRSIKTFFGFMRAKRVDITYGIPINILIGRDCSAAIFGCPAALYPIL